MHPKNIKKSNSKDSSINLHQPSSTINHPQITSRAFPQAAAQRHGAAGNQQRELGAARGAAAREVQPGGMVGHPVVENSP